VRLLAAPLQPSCPRRSIGHGSRQGGCADRRVVSGGDIGKAHSVIRLPANSMRTNPVVVYMCRASVEPMSASQRTHHRKAAASTRFPRPLPFLATKAGSRADFLGSHPTSHSAEAKRTGWPEREYEYPQRGSAHDDAQRRLIPNCAALARVTSAGVTIRSALISQHLSALSSVSRNSRRGCSLVARPTLLRAHNAKKLAARCDRATLQLSPALHHSFA